MSNEGVPPLIVIQDVQDKYLELLKRILTRSGFESYSLVRSPCWGPRPSLRGRVRDALFALIEKRGFLIVERVSVEVRGRGGDWPSDAETMVGMERLNNLQYCVETVLQDSVEGDLIETGAWRGGASIFMRGILAAHGVADRVVWVADSFQGLPAPDGSYPADANSLFHTQRHLEVSESQVRDNFARYGLMDEQVRFLVGWFKDTLPVAPIETLAVVRLDGDMYESTMQALDSLYPKLSSGGFLIVDDYAIPHCRQAIDDYRRDHAITDEVVRIDEESAYWRKSK